MQADVKLGDGDLGGLKERPSRVKWQTFSLLLTDTFRAKYL